MANETPAAEKVVDVDVNNQGSIFLFTPLTEAGKEWIEQNVSDEAQYMGNALVVEHRYASDLADGMMGDGLVLE